MRLRLFLSYVLVVLVATTSLVLVARQGAARELRSYMIHGNMTGLDELAEDLEAYYASNFGWDGVEALLRSPGAGRGNRFGQGMDNMAGMMGGSMMSQRLRLADAEANVLVDTAGLQPTGKLNQNEISRAQQLMVEGAVVGYLLPDGGMEFASGDETFLINRITVAALVAGLIATIASLVLATLLAVGLMRPIRELTHAAEHMAGGDLTQRVQARGGDEMATLGIAFNQMAHSLQKAEESRQAITSDIAHELRNPLAVQRANLEALQDGIYPLTPEYLEPILEQNQLLTRLVDDLRTLALADSGKLDLIRSRTDLAALTDRVVERYKAQASSRGIHIVQETKSLLPSLDADPQRIDQVLSNLLSNALRHTPDGGVISIKLNRNDRQAILTVHDTGLGIPEDALPYVFERFYRADKSRSRAEGGTGLGLAIARQLAQAHGGDLTASNSLQGGAEFTLVLPLSGG